MDRIYSPSTFEPFREEERQQKRQQEEAEQRRIELDANDTPTLHDFPKLPAELRRRVWELFCPELDLKTKFRILNFNVESQQRSNKCAVRDGMELAETTLLLRRTASVCRDSRELVHRRYPDTLRINANFGDLPYGEIIFSKQRDIPVLKIVDGPMPPALWEDGFFEKLTSVAFSVNRRTIGSMTGVPEFLAKLPNLQNIYLCRSYYQTTLRYLDASWCGSPLVNTAYVTTTENSLEYGVDYDEVRLYCWPDPSTLSLDPIAQGVTKLKAHLDPDLVKSIEETGVKLAPMIRFQMEEDWSSIQARVRAGSPMTQDRSSDPEEEEGSEGFGDPDEEDEFENDGFIDDTEQPELVESSEDELVPRAIVSGDDSEDSSSKDGSDDDSNGPSAQLAQEAAGRFSSPEPEPEGETGQDSSAITRRPKRRIVEDSDDEEEVAAPSRKRARQVISSDEEDEADEVDEKPEPAAKKPVSPRAASSESSSEEESSDEDESEDEDETTKKRVPVWKQPAAPVQGKTGRARARKDVDEESSDAEVGYDHETADDDDGEEEDDDEDEEGVEYGGYGLVDDMAVESGEGEENSDEEENW
jgi:hypothetical protein